MKINARIVKAAADHVTKSLPKLLDEKFGFHDLYHTQSVVNAVEQICTGSNVKKHTRNILLVAAWFHDIGYTERIEEHEDIGALHAENFLLEYDIDPADIEIVKSAIIATHYPQHPLTPGEMILCDADMIHLADKNYPIRMNVLRKEWEDTRGKFYSDAEWINLNISFLSAHKYYTEYCQVNCEERKQKNIKKLEAMNQLSPGVPDAAGEAEVYEMKKSKKEKQPDYSRGVDTLFKIASANHMRLSGMADNKAHILLSINSIIISIILSVLAKKLAEVSYLVWPTIILLAVCLISIVFAVLTTRPKVSKHQVSMDQVSNQQINLLFFGNFHRMEPDAYEWGIGEVMKDKDYLYKTLTKDIYYLGKVLAVKYRYLNIGYTVFMCGLILSVLSFAVSFFLSHPVL